MYCEHLDKADTATTPSDATMMNGNDYLIGVFPVPTKGSKEAEESSQKKEIDTRYLNAQDLKTLKKQDPFLYYSLPSSVRRNAATADGAGKNKKDMDYMPSPLIGKSIGKSTSMPTTTMTSTKVERRSCISFECHTDLLMEDEWLNDADAAVTVNEGFEVDVDFEDSI